MKQPGDEYPEEKVDPWHEAKVDPGMPELVATLSELKRRFSIPDTAQVLDSGSNTNVAVSSAFGKEGATHLDPDEQAMGLLKEHGYRTVTSTMEDYSPQEPFDVLVGMNSYGTPTADTLKRLVKPGGLIIANNYTGWAHDITESGVAKLEGGVLPAYYAPEAEYLPGGEIDPRVLEIGKEYYIFPDFTPINDPSEAPDGAQIFVEEDSAELPDAIFIFRMTDQSSPVP